MMSQKLKNIQFFKDKLYEKQCFPFNVLLHNQKNLQKESEQTNILMQCKLCTNSITNQPIQCPECQSVYGFNCIQTHQNQQTDYFLCPNKDCNKKIEQNLTNLINNLINTIISSEFQIICPYECQVKDIQCNIKAIQEHLKKCEFKPLQCENKGCDFQVNSQEKLKQHLLNCDLIQIQCKICKENYQKKEFIKHQRTNCYQDDKEQIPKMFENILSIMKQQNTDFQNFKQIQEQEIKNLEYKLKNYRESYDKFLRGGIKNLIEEQIQKFQYPPYYEIGGSKKGQYEMNIKKAIINNYNEGVIHFNNLEILEMIRQEEVPVISSIYLDIVNLGEYQQCYNTKQNQQKLLQHLHLLASKGDVKTQYSLSQIYLNGDKFISKNLEKSHYWAQEAAKQDYSGGYYMFGLFYKDGIFCTKNYGSSKECFEIALGIYSGSGIVSFFSKNFSKKKENKTYDNVLEEQQNVHFPPALYELGLLYITGQGTQKNLEKGLKMIQQSADIGYHKALNFMGNLYKDGKYIDLIVKKDIELAYNYHLKAALKNNIESMQFVIFSNELGKPLFNEPNQEIANLWKTKMKNFAEAKYNYQNNKTN